MIMIKNIFSLIPGIANVGGLAGTQMPERVLSDAYEKGGKQMIGDVVISVIILIITYLHNRHHFNSHFIMIIIESGSEHYQETDCPFGDSLMVMGEGFSQVNHLMTMMPMVTMVLVVMVVMVLVVMGMMMVVMRTRSP